MDEIYFTSRILEKGQVFGFYTETGTLYNEGDVIEVWTGHYDCKNIYGKALVIEVPIKPTGLYKAMMVG